MSDVFKGVALALFASFIFSFANSVVKIAGQDTPVAQLVFLRALAGSFLLSPLVYKHGFKILKSGSSKLQFLRVLAIATSTFLFYYGVSVLPLALAVTLSFSSVLFMMPVTFLMLSERPSLTRIIATLSGFLGVIIVLRPGVEPFSLPMAALLFGAFAHAIFLTIAKKLATFDNPLTPLLWHNIGCTLIFAPVAFYFWETTSLTQFLIIASIALLGNIGHFSLIKAYYLCDTSTINPINFFQLIFSVVLGYLIFNETVSIYTVIGSLVIIYSSWVIIRQPKT